MEQQSENDRKMIRVGGKSGWGITHHPTAELPIMQVTAYVDIREAAFAP
ncbi:MAG: hypothetical protein WCT12_09345 [Verrucomicrobiota bacterium]